jgi:magnesium transporter
VPARPARQPGTPQGRPFPATDPALLRGRLYDAAGRDRDVVVSPALVAGLKSRQLLWIDIDSRDADRFTSVVTGLDIPIETSNRVLDDFGRAGLIRYKAAIHLTVETIEADDQADDGFLRRELDILARRNVVITVHDGSVGALERFQDQVHGDTLIGKLDAGAFLEAIVDTVLTTYFGHIEAVERDIDRLDELAMRARDPDRFLAEVVRLRRRVARLRRTIAPHREALAPLARSDVALDEVLGHPLPNLEVRLERVIDALENVRQLLVGSFDIYLGRAAHRSNEVMKVLTIVSAVLLPGVVLAGVMGMNFHLAFFDRASNFWLVIGAMVAFAALILVVARLRRWI